MEIYRRVHDEELARALIDQLSSAGIDCSLKIDKQVLDEIYVGSNPMSTQYCIKVDKNNFELSDQALQNAETKEVIPEGHYLLDFNKEELLEILAKPDEWSDFDYRNAKIILEEKGVELSLEQLDGLKANRIEKLKVPEKSHEFWIIIGYITTVTGGLLGSMIGAHLAFFKKTLPNGEKVSPYCETDQSHGKRMFYFGIITTIITVFSLMKAYT